MNDNNIKEAIFAGGCFWCMETPFLLTDGVVKVRSGYIGGEKKFPTYEEVSTGSTGHYEAVKIWYDETKVSYKYLLGIFFQSMNPTDPYGQFADRGSQYLGGIFYDNEIEKTIAVDLIKAIDESNIFDNPIAVILFQIANFMKLRNIIKNTIKKINFITKHIAKDQEELHF